MIRAELFSELLVKHLVKNIAGIEFPPPWKHFIFGQLGVHSENSDPKRCGNEVRWKYHVVPIVRLNDNHVYILDPIVNPAPVRKEEYYHMITTFWDTSITGSVTCLPITYQEGSKCFQSDQPAMNRYLRYKAREKKSLAVFLDR